MTVQDLRDVLRERAGAPSPANPYRHDQVRARVRRTRLRRRVAAGVAVAAAVVVGVALLPGEQPRETTAVAAQAGPELPERFTAEDGTEYRLLASATIKAKGPEKATVTVPVSGKPLDVAAVCDGDFANVSPRIRIDGRATEGPDFSPCMRKNWRDLRPLTVPEGVSEVTVEFDTTVRGGGCVSAKRGAPCRPVEIERADWRLAVYEWTPPARPVDPGALRDFPGKLGSMRLADTASGLWDRDSSFTLVVESRGGKIGIEQLCAGDLSQRTWFTYEIDGKSTNSSVNCGVWTKGPYPLAMSEHKVPKGKRVTITGRVGLWGESTNRPVRWSAAVYAK
ncbi:hypothetical protein ACTWPT_55360 [Nonomuraea sp. 3N208]|uniref:hypothetical protein n=1 Tax=Nonomuraea sp. 3N208 TaxID=3457421 RepID=UPI003FCF1A09